jgi:hypothetical protein
MFAVAKSARHSTNDTKATSLPESDRSFIRAYDKVELHGREPSMASILNRVLAEHTSDPLTARRRCYHVTSVGHVIPEPGLVWAQRIRPDDSAVMFAQEGPRWRRCPGFPSFVNGQIRWVSVGVASRNNVVEDRPYQIEFIRPDLANFKG